MYLQTQLYYLLILIKYNIKNSIIQFIIYNIYMLLRLQILFIMIQR